MGSGNLPWNSISLLCGAACPNSASCSLLRLFFPWKVLPSGARSVLPRVPPPSPSLPTARPAMFYLDATVPPLR